MILLFTVKKRAQRYMFNSLLPNILAKKFYLGSKKKAKVTLYACNIVNIPVKRTEGAIVKKQIISAFCVAQLNRCHQLFTTVYHENSKPTALWLAIFIPMLTDYVVFSSLLKLTVHNTRFPSSRQEKSARSCILIERF